MYRKTTDNIYRFALLLCLGVLSAFGSRLSAKPELTVKLDSASMVMGRIGYLHAQVVLDRGQQLRFPLLEQASQEGLVPFLGDTIELRSAFSRDTVPLGGQRIQVNCHIPMQPWVPGTYMLPALTVLAGNDSASSQPIALKVTGPEVTANDSISPSVGPLQPYGTKLQKFSDKIPDVIYYWWWLIVIIILAIGVTVWAILRRRGKKLPWQKPKPVTPPYELAMQRLKALKASGLAEEADAKPYFTELSDILREYLAGRFGINAMEMTTQQIRAAVRNSPNAKVGRQHIDTVLDMADFVKFAKFSALPDDKVSAFTAVLQFVEQTKPQPKPDKSDTSANSQLSTLSSQQNPAKP